MSNGFMVLPPWTICPECLGFMDHNAAPWTASFPHKDGCKSTVVVCPNIASEEGVRMTARAFENHANPG